MNLQAIRKCRPLRAPGNAILAQAIARCENVGRYAGAARRQRKPEARHEKRRTISIGHDVRTRGPIQPFKQPGYTSAFSRRDRRPRLATTVSLESSRAQGD